MTDDHPQALPQIRPDGWVTIDDLAERWGIAPSTIRSALRPGGWMPQPDGLIGRAHAWREERVANVKRRRPGRPSKATATAQPASEPSSSV